MSVGSSFLARYDKTSSPAFAAHNDTQNSFEVREYEQGATVTLLRVNLPGADFISFNHQLVKGMKDLTQTRSSSLLDSDCDGISFVEHQGKDGIVVAELKSRFNTQHIKKAYGQLVFSFAKLHAMLSLCTEYDIDDLMLHFVVSCKCFENINQEEGVMNTLMKAESVDCDCFEKKFLRKLIKHHRLVIKIGEIASIYGLTLNPVIANKEITLALQLTDTYASTSADYNI